MRTTFLEKRLFSFFLSLFVLFGCFFFFWQRDRSIGFDFEFFSYSIACMILCFLFYRLLLFLFSFLKRSETGSYYSSKYVHSHGVQEVLKTSRISFRTCLKKDLEDLEKRRYITKEKDSYHVTTILKNYGVFDSHLRVITDYLQSGDKSFKDFFTPAFKKCYLKLLVFDMEQAGLLKKQGIFLDFLSYIIFVLYIVLLASFSLHGFYLPEISGRFGQLFLFFLITCLFQFVFFHFVFRNSYQVTSFGKSYKI